MSIEKLDFEKVIQENKNFTTHLNLVLQNLRDASALGVWCYLSSLPTNWTINKTQIRDHFGFGRDKLNSILKLLKSANLIEIKPARNKKGTFDDGLILVKAGYNFEPHTENPSSVKSPDTCLPLTANQLLVNRNIKIKEVKKKIKTKIKDKSFCENQKKQNNEKHDWAAMKNEQAEIERNEVYKRTPMPANLREFYQGVKARGGR